MNVLEKFLGLTAKSERTRETYRNRIGNFCREFNVSLEQIVKEWDKI